VNRPADGGDGAAEAPPTYEQSRTDRVVRPGGQEQAPQLPQRPGHDWGGFGTNPNAAAGRGRGRGRGGGNSVIGAANIRDTEDRCVIM
jgi:hypothetical protein